MVEGKQTNKTIGEKCKFMCYYVFRLNGFYMGLGSYNVVESVGFILFIFPDDSYGITPYV